MTVKQGTALQDFVLTPHQSFKWVWRIGTKGIPRDLTGSTVTVFIKPRGGPLYETEPSTTLSADITAIATSLDVVDAIGFADEGLIKIDDEVIAYTARTDTQFSGLTRGAEGTTAATHLNIASVTTVSKTFEIDSAGPANQKLFIQPSSTLSADITSLATSLTVADASKFAAKGFVKIDSEIIEYAERTATQLSGLVRASAGTTAASHVSAATVRTSGQVRAYISDETIDAHYRNWKKAEYRVEIEDSLLDREVKFAGWLKFEKTYA